MYQDLGLPEMYHFTQNLTAAEHLIDDHKHVCESCFDTFEYETEQRGHSNLWLVPTFMGGIFAWLMVFYGLSLLF